MNFTTLKLAVQKQFAEMQNHQLFRVNVDKDQLWATYLSSFPEGTDPIYRERTEHDCSCCRQFVKNVGDVVAIIDGKVVSIWDVTVKGEPAYQAVVDGLSKFVKAAKIDNVFYHFERTAGTDKNFEQLTSGVKTWDHFFVNIKPQFVKAGASIPSLLGEHRAAHDVFVRSVKEIKLEAIDEVLDLISQNSLLRGAESKFAIQEFRKIMVASYQNFVNVENYLWLQSLTVPQSVSRIRNTPIGTLLNDLSEGKDLEAAVASFETKVNGANYKRPTALVTPKMLENAKARLVEMGLVSALERRYANINDITINNILFADRAAKTVINGDVFDDLAATAKTKAKKLDKVEEVTIDKFISDILPRATTVEVMMENRHVSNLVSLIAPVDSTSGNLFKWDNKFSWSYNGEVADSIKERVKAAGGNVTGDLCCRLAWDYTDDLDFHMKEPDGYHLYFGNRTYTSDNGGRLDVDANGGSGMMKEPVENIFYADRNRMKNGTYSLSVKNFSRRSRDGVGFTVQIEFDGQIQEFTYNSVLRDSMTMDVATIEVKNGEFTVKSKLPSSTGFAASKSFWGVNTNTFQKVNVIMLSPNFWDEKSVGNKHFFFMLDGCKNDTTARGFYNEFLKEELNADRKVLELVGSKTKVADSDNQLSGLGFSSTQKNSIVVRVTGAITRTIKVVF